MIISSNSYIWRDLSLSIKRIRFINIFWNIFGWFYDISAKLLMEFTDIDFKRAWSIFEFNDLLANLYSFFKHLFWISMTSSLFFIVLYFYLLTKCLFLRLFIKLEVIKRYFMTVFLFDYDTGRLTKAWRLYFCNNFCFSSFFCLITFLRCS